MGQHSTRVPDTGQPDRLTDEDPEWVENRRWPPDETEAVAESWTLRDRLRAAFEF